MRIACRHVGDQILIVNREHPARKPPGLVVELRSPCTSSFRHRRTFFCRAGFTHVQFIPAMDFQAMEPERPPAYLISPEQYGRFLTEAFDVWYEGGFPRISVRIFDNFLQTYVGLPNDLGVHSELCDAGIVVEYDGSAYPCDFYTHPRWRLGNVLTTPLREIAEGPARRAFIFQKQPLPEECARCEWLSVCKSGCFRARTVIDGENKPDHFCASYKRFFPHADERLRRLGAAVNNKRRYLEILGTGPGPRDGPERSVSLRERAQAQAELRERARRRILRPADPAGVALGTLRQRTIADQVRGRAFGVRTTPRSARPPAATIAVPLSVAAQGRVPEKVSSGAMTCGRGQARVELERHRPRCRAVRDRT